MQSKKFGRPLEVGPGPGRYLYTVVNEEKIRQWAYRRWRKFDLSMKGLLAAGIDPVEMHEDRLCRLKSLDAPALVLKNEQGWIRACRSYLDDRDADRQEAKDRLMLGSELSPEFSELVDFGTQFFVNLDGKPWVPEDDSCLVKQRFDCQAFAVVRGNRG